MQKRGRRERGDPRARGDTTGPTRRACGRCAAASTSPRARPTGPSQPVTCAAPGLHRSIPLRARVYPRRGCHVAGAQPPRREKKFPPRTPPARGAIRFAVRPLSPAVRRPRGFPRPGPRAPSRSRPGPSCLPAHGPRRRGARPTPHAIGSARRSPPTSVPIPYQPPLPPCSLPLRSHHGL